MLNEIPSPLVIPVPHRLGFWHVVVPPGATFQPWLARICLAVETENVHGLNERAEALTSGLGGETGTGPHVGMAVLFRYALIHPCWSSRCWNAWRKYIWLKIGPTVGLCRLSGK